MNITTTMFSEIIIRSISVTTLTLFHLKDRKSRCLQRYEMNIKTNILEEYINFVDNTKKQNKNLWICTIILVFIVIILTIMRVLIHS